jgi:hypothetical protein
MRSVGIEPPRAPQSGNAKIYRPTGKERYSDTGFHYTGARYLHATSESKRTRKPILILFGDGCTADDESFVRVLPHPLLREAADTLFVTIVVDSQATFGNDAALMAKYSMRKDKKHPPVGWIMDSEGKKLAPRMFTNSIETTARTMTKALKSKKSKVPRYLDMVLREASAIEESSVFGMPSQSDGEIVFATLEGVVSTQTGRLGSKQCVEVSYDTKQVSYRKLVRHALRHGDTDVIYCRDENERKVAKKEAKRSAKGKSIMVGVTNEAMQPDDAGKKYLCETLLCHVPLTRLQKLQMNLRLFQKKSCLKLLSPRQRFIMDVIQEDEQNALGSRLGPRVPSWITYY